MSSMHTPGGDDAQKVNEALGRALRQLRKSTGIGQVELAKRLHVEQTAISRWERGMDAIPAYRLPLIERALECPAGSLWAAAGLLNLDPVAQAIYADEQLGAVEKRTLTATYEALRGQTGGSAGKRKS
jgi:transcriptional regulator with XRE-family HTH domain